MTTIKLTTEINAPIQTVFDLARNIDIHKQSTARSNETVIDGIRSGLINKDETVTFRGKHFGFYLTHTSLIPEMEFPYYFVDEMVKGRFKKFKHQHIFEEKENKTFMIDLIEYEAPFGIIVRFFDVVLLKNHLLNLLAHEMNLSKNELKTHNQCQPKNRDTLHPESCIISISIFIGKK